MPLYPSQVWVPCWGTSSGFGSSSECAHGGNRGGLVPTAGFLPAHSSEEICQKAAGNKLLLQQWFQLVGSWEGLCRLGHHSFAATTQL